MKENGTANHFGFYTALLFALSCVVAGISFFGVVIIAAESGYQWDGMEGFATFYQDGNQFIISFAWSTAFFNALLYPVLLTFIHYSIPQDKRIYTQIGLIFSSAGMIIACGYEYLQLTLVRQGILSDSLAGLDMFAIFNPQSVVSALSFLGWMLFMGIALFSIAFVFSNDKLQKWIRALLIVIAILGIIAGMGNIFAVTMFALIYFLATTLLLPIAAILISIYFKRKSLASQFVSP